MTTARELLNNNVQQQLNDPRGELWSLNELLAYLNEGLQQMLEHVPQEFAAVVPHTLAAGTRQTLPAQAERLVDVLANKDGRAPFLTTLRALGLGDPSWRNAPAGAAIEWAYDQRDPDVFWVSPPATAGDKLDIEVVQHPSVLRINAKLPIRRAYHAALADYVLYRAMAKDADYAGSGGLASMHYNQYLAGLGVSGGDSQ